MLEPCPMIAVDAGHYTAFIYGFISIARAMLQKLKGRRDPGSLTGVLILCYFLCSVFHTPPETLKTSFNKSCTATPIRQYIAAYKCRRNNVIPFLPGVFRLDQENKLHCNVVFGDDVLLSFFPGVKPSHCRAPVYNDFSNPEIDAFIRQDMLAILPDNDARPTGNFTYKFDQDYVKGNTQAVDFVAEFYHVINENGFDSNRTVREFTRLLFAEYFLTLPGDLFLDPKIRPTIHWLSHRNNVDRYLKPVFKVAPFERPQVGGTAYPVAERLGHILPFFTPTARPKMLAALKQKAWHKLGMRSIWIQLFLHAQSRNALVTHAQLRTFYLKVCTLVFFYSECLLMPKKDGLYLKLKEANDLGGKKDAVELRRTCPSRPVDFDDPWYSEPHVISPLIDLEEYAVGVNSGRPVVRGIVGKYKYYYES